MRVAGIALAFALLLVPKLALEAESASGERNLLLEVWINGRNQHVIAPVTESGDRLQISKDVLNEIGIRSAPGEVDSSGRIDVMNLAGVSARVDELDQILRVQAVTERLTPQLIDLRPAQDAFHPATAGTGIVVDYDAVVTNENQDRGRSAGAALRASDFTPWGALTATGFGTLEPGQNRFTRLDTTIELDDQGALRQWTFGDTISGGLSWSRPVRFAGVHVATDFSLEPDLVTQPLPRFFGQTTVPAGVDVFVNAAKVLEAPVDPGPFEIRNLPVVTGGGTVDVVVRDELGRAITHSISFYTTPLLLARGLSAYSFDVGALRRSYGQRSFDYGGSVAEATLAYGLSDRLTLESHSEASADVFVGGGGVVLAVPPFGIIESSAAASHSRQGGGNLVALAAQSQTHPINLFASYTATSEYYADVGSTGAVAPRRRRLQAGADVSVGAHGSFAVSWIDIRGRTGEPTRLAAVAYALSPSRGLFLGITGIDDVENGKLSAEAFLSIPLGGGTNLGGSVRRASGANTETLSLARPANPDGGVGYRVLGATGTQETAEADVTWIEEHGRLDAGVSSVGGLTATRVGASGAVILMDGALFATRTSDDAFALVRTGEPNVEIYHENRPVGRSDAKGEALVPDLNAYESNRLSVDPRDYPMSMIVTDPERIVVPRRRSGVIADFSPRKLHPVRVTVRLENGDYPPIGAPVLFTGVSEPFVVGHHGEIFIPDLTSTLTARMTLVTAWCYFQVQPPSRTPPDAIPQLGPVVCTEERAHGP